MNEIQIEYCNKILNHIKEHPFGSMVEHPTPPVRCNHHFSSIGKKLNHFRYISVYDFAIDLQYLLHDERDSSEPDSNEYYIYFDFIKYVRKKLYVIPTTEEQIRSHRIHGYLEALANANHRLKVYYKALPPPPKPVPVPKKTNAFSGLIRASDIEWIQSRINEAVENHDNKKLFKLFHMLAENIPELELKEKVVVEKSQINSQMLKKMKSILSS